MSMNNLTIDGEFRYIVQWFNEWSELQRDDFVPIIVNYITDITTNDDDDNELTASVTAPVNMNGLPNDLEFNGRPMSLFQCRIKLFKQWNRKWPVEFKEKLQQKITEIDGKVGEKIKFGLNPNNGNLTNGCASNELSLEEENLCSNKLNELKENDKDIAEAVNNGVLVMALNDDPMTDVLNNETSVDDVEANEDVNKSCSSNIATTTVYTDNNHDDNDDDVAAAACNDSGVCINTTHTINEQEPVEHVAQMQNLQINEEKEEENDREDVTEIVDQKQQQQLPSVTVTVNSVVVAQTISSNAEVPLVA